MSFKNAFKLLISRFSYVWVLLAYILMLFVVLFTLGLTFLLPVIDAFRDAGITDKFSMALLSFFDGASIKATFDAFLLLYADIRSILAVDPRAFVNSALFVILVMNIALRFLLGLYELPLVSVIQGLMSDNAKYGYAGKYVALFGRSARFSLVKMLVMTAYDCIMWAAVYGFTLLGGIIGVLAAPFFFMLSTLVLLAFRFAMISAWSPAVIVDGRGIFAGLGFSLRHAFKNFGSLFSVFTVAWIILFVINFIIGLFTFMVGLLVTIPISMFLINLINMTSYYAKNGKSYYIDGAVYVPEPPKKASVKK